MLSPLDDVDSLISPHQQSLAATPYHHTDTNPPVNSWFLLLISNADSSVRTGVSLVSAAI